MYPSLSLILRYIYCLVFQGASSGLFQTVTQLQEQTLPFGVKLLCVSVCFFLMSGWYGEKLYSFGIEMLNLAFARG
ncbi:EscS/YscS/HrcS family type III secretion system export apparatus protein [Escherichia coli]|uniref:EscS/YscS/HrcS family type III secretion system export apparatus protein n=1 Tax=Escherichia coli TaxID=562 RepID=UPI003F84D075